MSRWKNWTGAVATVVLLTASSCASWTPEQKEYTAYGAAGGALAGGGVGCGVAALESGSAKGYEIGCPAGVFGGALIGGAIGYLLAPKEAPYVAPPPPPPPPPP
ncbi:MAG: hypothetical protein WBY93_00925, partial [Candidatus Binatus sp.]